MVALLELAETTMRVVESGMGKQVEAMFDDTVRALAFTRSAWCDTPPIRPGAIARARWTPRAMPWGRISSKLWPIWNDEAGLFEPQ